MASLLFVMVAADVCASCQRQQEVLQSSRRRTRSSHSSDAFESLPLKKGLCLVIVIIIVIVAF